MAAFKSIPGEYVSPAAAELQRPFQGQLSMHQLMNVCRLERDVIFPLTEKGCLFSVPSQLSPAENNAQQFWVCLLAWDGLSRAHHINHHLQALIKLCYRNTQLKGKRVDMIHRLRVCIILVRK